MTVEGTPGALRYDYTVDVTVDSTATKILSHVPGGARVLDLGCGPGALARVLVERGAVVTGVEFDAAAAKRAELAGATVVVADLDTTDLTELFAGRVFDVVIAADVLEHLRDPAATLRQVRELLAPAGYAVVSVPNVAHASVRLALLAGSFPYTDTGLLDRTHLHFWTRSSLLELLAGAGFTAAAVAHQDLGPLDSEVVVPEASRTAEALAAATADPDALAYQFVVLAVPRAEVHPDQPPLITRLVEVTAAAGVTADDARRRADDLSSRLARLAGVDPLAPDGLPSPETVVALLAARDGQARAELALSMVNAQLQYKSEALERAETDRAAWQSRAKEIDEALARTEAARVALEARWARVMRHPAVRAARLGRRVARRLRASSA